MKIILMSLITFFYGICTAISEYRFNGAVVQKINSGKPLIDKKLIKMSEKCYNGRRKFAKMEKRLKLEIAKRENL